MTKRRGAVRAFADEAGIDVDEALINLWDAGFDYVVGPDDTIRKREGNRARRALGLATRRELTLVSLWRDLLNLDNAALADLLKNAGTDDVVGERALSKKAVQRLKSEARRCGLWRPRVEPEPAAIRAPEPAPLVWRTVGHARHLKYLSVTDVEMIHQALVEDCQRENDPIAPPGVKSRPLLESAIGRPTTANGDVLKYPTVEMSAAALLHALIHNHPFHNGNKRTALVATLVLLDENGIVLICDEDELFKFVLQLAQHAIVAGPQNDLPDREVLAIAEWLRCRCRWVEKGDRSIPWRRLRRILLEYGCELSVPMGGNRINITRRLGGTRRFLVRSRGLVLHTQTFFNDEGREVQGNTINKIRRELHLDDDHGVDSATFYDRVPAPPSEFIIRYRKTIRRLAKV